MHAELMADLRVVVDSRREKDERDLGVGGSFLSFIRMQIRFEYRNLENIGIWRVEEFGEYRK